MHSDMTSYVAKYRSCKELAQHMCATTFTAKRDPNASQNRSQTHKIYLIYQVY
jgi:hypothetical protein